MIILIYVNRNWDRWKSRLGRQYLDDQPGGEAAISSQRRGELEALANDVHTESTSGKGIFTATCKLDNINDTELLYMAKYYERALTRGDSMYKDIDDRWGYVTSCDEKVMAKLSAMGMK